MNLHINEQVGPFFSEDQNVDIAFLYGDGIWSGMESVKLFDEYCIAVCSPEYLYHKTLDTQSLNGCVLLQLSSRLSAWYDYFKQQDINVDGTFTANITGIIGCGLNCSVRECDITILINSNALEAACG